VVPDAADESALMDKEGGKEVRVMMGEERKEDI
jgi:hypothetical protein